MSQGQGKVREKSGNFEHRQGILISIQICIQVMVAAVF